MIKLTFILVKKYGLILAVFISLHFFAVSIYADVPEIVQHPKDTLDVDGVIVMDVLMKNHTTTYTSYQYEWRKNGIPIPGENSYYINLNVNESDHGAEIDVIVSNAEGSVTSEKAFVLICSQPPIFKSNLEDNEIDLYGEVRFSIDFYGNIFYSYQWYHNGQEIPRANTLSYNIDLAQEEHEGEYYVAINARDHIHKSNIINLNIIEPKFLFIIASSLQTNKDFMDIQLDQYEDVVESYGWDHGKLFVDKNNFPDEEALKLKIKEKFNEGFRGFVIIGSDDEIPTAYWRVTDIETDKKNGKKIPSTPLPTDLYYADIHDWEDIDDDGIYESYHAIQNDKGEWVPDETDPVNPNNTPFIPEFFFGRITPKLINTDNGSVNDMIFDYLDKMFDARNKGGSHLPQEEMKNRGLVFLDEDWNFCEDQVDNIRQVTNNIKRISNISLTNATVLKEELNKGYRFLQQMIHSAPNAHSITEWSDGQAFETKDYNLSIVKNTNVMVDYANMFSCSAAKFDVPNFASTYLYYTDYTINVTGSTGEWGPALDEEYYKQLALGIPIGIVVRNYIKRKQSDLSIPKMILHGDPLFTYAKDNNNEAPHINNDYNYHGLCYVEAHVGEQLTINFTADDPDENETLEMNMDGFPMPEQSAFFNPVNNSFSWTPSDEFENTTHSFRINAIDKAGNISTEDFTIYVALLNDGYAWEFENEQSGIVSKKIIRAATPFEKYTYKIQTNNSWGAFKQKTDVRANEIYKLSFYYKGETDELVNAYIKIPELDKTEELYIKKKKDYTYFKTVFFTNNTDNITIKLYLGDENDPQTGQIYLHGVELRNIGQQKIGDVDCDGFISGTDMLMIDQHLININTLTQSQRYYADVNCDNIISYHDLELIQAYIGGNITSLPYNCNVGDIDNNGIIDQADSDLAAQYYINLVTLTPEQVIMANVNNGDPDDPDNDYDKEVNILDALSISQYINGIITELPFFKR